jgi:hypothetical protein
MGNGAERDREGRFGAEAHRTMDATRTRRTRDRARQAWYARYRQQRFARFLGFAVLSIGERKAPRTMDN